MDAGKRFSTSCTSRWQSRAGLRLQERGVSLPTPEIPDFEGSSCCGARNGEGLACSPVLAKRPAVASRALGAHWPLAGAALTSGLGQLRLGVRCWVKSFSWRQRGHGALGASRYSPHASAAFCSSLSPPNTGLR